MNQRTEQEIMNNWKTKDKPLVSICCGTYNHENYITEAIDGFLMQETNFPFEIIIRDDFSTDKTAAIIKKYTEKYPNLIKPIFEKENQYSKGVKHWPVSIKAAVGKYIALCEGDDYWTDVHKLQIQVDALIQHKDYKLSFHLCSELINGTETIRSTINNNKKIYTVKEIINSDFHFVQTNTIMFRRDVLDNLDMNLLNNSPVGDVWIRITASMPNGAILINKVMGTYRVQSVGSWSERMKKDENFLEFINKMINSINQFDEYWGFKYTKEFKNYKNRFIEVILRKKSISLEDKNKFLQENYSSVSIVTLLKWNFIYKHPDVIYFLRLIKGRLLNDK